jgi:hypothetical protein
LRGGNKTSLVSSPSVKIEQPYQPLDISITVPFNDLQLNDEFAIEAIATDPNVYL